MHHGRFIKANAEIAAQQTYWQFGPFKEKRNLDLVRHWDSCVLPTSSRGWCSSIGKSQRFECWFLRLGSTSQLGDRRNTLSCKAYKEAYHVIMSGKFMSQIYGIGDQRSNLGQVCLCLTLRKCFWKRHESVYSTPHLWVNRRVYRATSIGKGKL